MENLKTGEVIGKRRRELGLTQNQLASSLNVSFQAVSKWENGASIPDVMMLPKLAAVLNTTVDALVGYSAVVADYYSIRLVTILYWAEKICYTPLKTVLEDADMPRYIVTLTNDEIQELK
ncbi:MAG: helix-turn-helix transcriptional regulator, partial [Lachnospiraceae bacterium]|nr:helix-turn-helix transcriptional regulator [Lachnospiraceae bacterium]